MPLTPQQLSIWRGHPTSPGVRDDIEPRIVDGRRPKVQPSPSSQGPGTPGRTSTGPMQPGTIYENSEEES